MARHDARRTGQATGRGDITQPTVYWKRYIGGRLDPAAFLPADVDGDGATEFLMLIGGSAVAKRRLDTEVWRSPNLELTAFVGLLDLDGRAGNELVVRSADRVFVLDPANGQVVWAEPAGEMGTIGGTRLGDVDGDGLPDLVVQECGCCRVIGPNPGFVYSFNAGAAAARQLWALPYRRCGGQLSLTLVDDDGTPPSNVVVGDTRALVLLDGVTGAQLARSPDIGTRVYEARCVPVDLDGAPGEELVCAREARQTPTERGVFALRRNGAALEVMWQRAFEAVDGGAIDWVDLVADLDGTGAPEVVVSAAPDGVTWSTYVLSGTNGSIRATIPGEIGLGIAATPAGAVMLTASGFHMTGWRYVTGNLTDQWAVPDVIVPPTFDIARGMRSSVASRATVALVDGDAVPDVIATQRSQPGTLIGYDVTTTQAVERGRFTLPTNVSVLQGWPLAVSDTDLQLAIADNEGYMTLFDRQLFPLRPTDDDVGQIRLRTGGYYATGVLRLDNTLRSARIDAGPARVLVVDSRGSLMALDAELGSFAAPPRPLWELYGASAPSVVDRALGDQPGIACLATDQPVTSPPTYSVMMLDGRGQPAWRQPAPSKPLNDAIPGNFDGDAVPDLVFQWGDPGDLMLQTRAIAGTDGRTLWDATPVEPGGGRRPKGVAVGTFDGDAIEDVYHQAGTTARTQVLSGANGSQLASDGPDTPYSVVTLANLDGDAGYEVVLHAGPDPMRVLDDSLASSIMVSPDANRPFPPGAVADCGATKVLVEGSDINQARLKMTEVAGPNIGTEDTMVLAGGIAYANESSALASTNFLGAITAATVHQDLTGAARPTAVVGSSDGWLYAVNPCTGQVDWSYAFGAAVGEAIFSDTDGDGRDEILVTVQDGNLYELRNFELEAPEEVRDTDPFSGAGEDIDEIETESTLEATWSAVPGAIRYSVAVVDADGVYVGEPWQNAGSGTAMRLEDLPLADGFYRIAVRAHRVDDHYSVDTVSDGVWVVIGNEPGGCCRTSRPTSPVGSIVLVLVTAGVLVRRRRRATTKML